MAAQADNLRLLLAQALAQQTNPNIQKVAQLTPAEAKAYAMAHEGVHAADGPGGLMLTVPKMYATGDLSADGADNHILKPNEDGFIDSGALRQILGY